MTTLITARNHYGKIVSRCDQRCYNAKHHKCNCICRGKNHGLGRQAAVQQTPDIIADLLQAWNETHPKQQASTISQWRTAAHYATPSLFPCTDEETLPLRQAAG